MLQNALQGLVLIESSTHGAIDLIEDAGEIDLVINFRLDLWCTSSIHICLKSSGGVALTCLHHLLWLVGALIDLCCV